METVPAPVNQDITREPSAAHPFDGRARVAYADAFRAFAILVVVIDHLISRVAPRFDNIGGPLGVWGVDCFFVLTGFLLARPYLEAVLERRPFPSSRLFFARRFYRIWPTYALAVVVSALGERIHGGHHLSLADVATHLTMTYNFVPAFNLSKFNIPLWTMAVDADFYLLLPLAALAVIALVQRVPLAQRVRLLFVLFGLAIVASVLGRALIVHAVPRVLSDTDLGFTLLKNVFGMGASFVFGIILALLAVLKTPVRPALAYSALAIGAVAAISLFLVPSSAPPVVIFIDLVGGFSAALLLFACMHGAIPGADRVVGSKAVVTIAALSYSIYLFHAPVLNTIYDLVHSHYHHRASAAFDIVLVLAMLAGMVAVAYLAHHFVEQPFLRRKDALRERAA